MKKYVLGLALLVCLSVSAFADGQIGSTLNGQIGSTKSESADDSVAPLDKFIKSLDIFGIRAFLSGF